MGFVNFIIELLKDPRAAIAGWIAMGVAPTLGFILLCMDISFWPRNCSLSFKALITIPEQISYCAFSRNFV
mgnify:CR=1 FL=1